MQRACRRQGLRQGSITLESIMVLVVLLIVSLAAIQFGLALVVKQAVSHAATVAAREAAQGADPDQLVCVVNRVLKGHRIEIGEDASLILEGGVNPGMRGTLPCMAPATPVIDADEVRVTLCVSLVDRPPFQSSYAIPNGLTSWCIDFSNCNFMVSSVATNE